MYDRARYLPLDDLARDDTLFGVEETERPFSTNVDMELELRNTHEDGSSSR